MSLPALPPVGEPGTVEFSPKTVEISGAQVSEALFGKDGPGFKDLLAAINPLQHIPVVSTIYRHLTGDTISPGSRMAGGLLYGGPVGLAAAAVNATVEGMSGKDMGDHVLAMVIDPKAPAAPDAPVAVAAALGNIAPAAGPAETPPPTGPAVTANPVAPVQAARAPAPQPVAQPLPQAVAQAAPPPTTAPAASPPAIAETPAKAEPANAPLTPEAYARAMAKANGRAVPPLPVRGGAPAVAAQRTPAQAAVPELSNEQFARLLNSLTGNAAAEAESPAPPVPVSVPVPVDYRPPVRLNPYLQRSAKGLSPISTR